MGILPPSRAGRAPAKRTKLLSKNGPLGIGSKQDQRSVRCAFCQIDFYRRHLVELADRVLQIAEVVLEIEVVRLLLIHLGLDYPTRLVPVDTALPRRGKTGHREGQCR